MNDEPASPDSEWDHNFVSRFAGAPLPPTPAGLASRVRRRLRSRRHWVRGLAGAAAAAILIAVVLVWRIAWNPRLAPELARDPEPEPELLVLDVAPPVGNLDLLARHQAAYLLALEQMEKEF